MKFVVDKYIPFVAGVLEPFGSVSYLAPEEIDAGAVADADCLLVRTRTRVDARLLADSRCRFVGTATIGMDHYNMDDCRRLGVTAVNAPGCNAPAVAQYVLSSAARLAGAELPGMTIAVVGVGNVGGIVCRWAEGLGMRVLRVDPPRQERGDGGEWHSLDDAARLADIITFHTPLTEVGRHATRHLADSGFFESLQQRPVIINAARGAVVDNLAWLDAMERGLIRASAVDTWEGEPYINRRLMALADIATPHIAGYSLDGKIRAAQMVLDAVSLHFGLPRLHADAAPPADIPERVTVGQLTASYDPLADTAMMRRALADAEENKVKSIFESLRDHYPLRAEISAIR